MTYEDGARVGEAAINAITYAGEHVEGETRLAAVQITLVLDTDHGLEIVNHVEHGDA